ncbi:MAG: DoxX family protein [Bacteroidia bacterium]
MDTFHLIIAFGLILGIIAYGSYHMESYRRLMGQKRLVVLLLRLLGAVLTGVGAYMLVKNFAAYGAPGRNVLDTEASLLLPSILLLFGLADLYYAGMMGKSELKKQGRSIETQRPITHMLVWAIRIYVAALFIYSGFVKANDYIGFSYKLEEYFQVFAKAEYLPFLSFLWNFLEEMAKPLAWFISVFEIALAVAILLGWRMRLTAWLTMLMMIFFTILTGFSAITGEVTDCGCFGDAIKLDPWMSFTKDLVYLVILTPLFLLRKEIKAFPNNTLALAAVLLTFIGSGVYGWYCYENLPVIDYRAYKVGADLVKCTTDPGPDGMPKCKDWGEVIYHDYVSEERAKTDTTFVMPEPLKPLTGKVMMVVAYDLKHAPEDALKQSTDLAQALEGAGVKTLLVTSTGPSDAEKVIESTGIQYPISFRDKKMLKTIIRANPGYVLLNNGKIVAKWHHNNIPDVTEVQTMMK